MWDDAIRARAFRQTLAACFDRDMTMTWTARVRALRAFAELIGLLNVLVLLTAGAVGPPWDLQDEPEDDGEEWDEEAEEEPEDDEEEECDEEEEE